MHGNCASEYRCEFGNWVPERCHTQIAWNVMLLQNLTLFTQTMNSIRNQGAISGCRCSQVQVVNWVLKRVEEDAGVAALTPVSGALSPPRLERGLVRRPLQDPETLHRRKALVQLSRSRRHFYQRQSESTEQRHKGEHIVRSRGNISRTDNILDRTCSHHCM